MEQASDEAWIPTPDGLSLYSKSWSPLGPPKACVLFIHGFSDHIHRFEHFFAGLSQAGIRVYGFDQRGWGRSVRRKAERGRTGTTEQVLEDISTVLRSILPQVEVPLFLMGHSMGGAEVLTYAAAGPSELRARIRGYLALAPLIALNQASQPSRFLVLAGKLAKTILPQMQMVQKLRPELLCRDSEVAKSWEADPLCHDTGTLEGLDGMLQRAENLDKGYVKDHQGSFFVAHGTSDLITDHDASRRWVDRLAVADKEFKSYPEWYHVLHAEPGEDKTLFAADVANWMISRCGSGVTSAEKCNL